MVSAIALAKPLSMTSWRDMTWTSYVERIWSSRTVMSSGTIERWSPYSVRLITAGVCGVFLFLPRRSRFTGLTGHVPFLSRVR